LTSLCERPDNTEAIHAINHFAKSFHVMPPRVSVVLPTYNRANTLLRSVNSVLEQSYRDFELIVVDDGSTDRTPAIMRDVTDVRVRYLRSTINRGQSVSRNLGICESRGSLIAFQDSDDTWRSEKLARQVTVLDGDHNIAGVYCDLLRIPQAGAPYIVHAPDLVYGNSFDHRPSLYQSYAIGIQSCVLRKVVFDRSVMFRQDMRCFEDLELLLRLAKKYRMHRIQEPLVNYYQSHDGVCANSAAETQARIILFQSHGYRAMFANPTAWLKELKLYVKWKMGRLGPKYAAGGPGALPI
jgi:glycosyltransferase involved in cell wall biosynthesis